MVVTKPEHTIQMKSLEHLISKMVSQEYVSYCQTLAHQYDNGESQK